MYMGIIGITRLNSLIHSPNHDHQQGPRSVPVVSRRGRRFPVISVPNDSPVAWPRGGLLEPYVRSRARQ
jgi:hypothetical protein